MTIEGDNNALKPGNTTATTYKQSGARDWLTRQNKTPEACCGNLLTELAVARDKETAFLAIEYLSSLPVGDCEKFWEWFLQTDAFSADECTNVMAEHMFSGTVEIVRKIHDLLLRQGVDGTGPYVLGNDVRELCMVWNDASKALHKVQQEYDCVPAPGTSFPADSIHFKMRYVEAAWLHYCVELWCAIRQRERLCADSAELQRLFTLASAGGTG